MLYSPGQSTFESSVESGKSRIVSSETGTVEERKLTRVAESLCMYLCPRNESTLLYRVRQLCYCVGADICAERPHADLIRSDQLRRIAPVDLILTCLSVNSPLRSGLVLPSTLLDVMESILSDQWLKHAKSNLPFIEYRYGPAVLCSSMSGDIGSIQFMCFI